MRREGGLRLCACLHPLAYHYDRPLWYGSTETKLSCAFCDCAKPEIGGWQGAVGHDAEWRARTLAENWRRAEETT